jgi:hypothetical protein
MATEPSDHVAMTARLRRRKSVKLPQMLRRFGDESIAKKDAALEQSDLLRMAEGEHEKGLLPYGRQLSVVAALEAIDGEGQRLAVLRERLRGVAVHGARELVEHDDERQS